METAHGANLDSVGSDVWSTEEHMPGKETGWASFSEFTSSLSSKESLRSNSPVEMETNTEPMDPLSANVSALAAQPEAQGSVAMEASSDGEDDVENADKVTETVMNGSMKETLSLTVDAKTETAEGKLSTSQDVSCKYVVAENTEAVEEIPATPQPDSSSPEQR
uniref:Uncharacterized protein n=1 Tax=Gopherus agassizii TaxID=38772 RepID=A0A452H3X5_9SAUR